MIEVYHFAIDMPVARFFAEQESATCYAMRQRYGFDGQAAVFVDNFILCGVYAMKHHLVFQSLTKHFEHSIEHRLETCRSIDMQRCCATKHAKGGD